MTDFIDVRERLNGILETIELLESDLYEAPLPNRTRADWTQIIFHVDEAYEALQKAIKYATFEGGKTAQQEPSKTISKLDRAVELLNEANRHVDESHALYIQHQFPNEEAEEAIESGYWANISLAIRETIKLINEVKTEGEQHWRHRSPNVAYLRQAIKLLSE